MLLDHTLDLSDLRWPEAATALEANRLQPETSLCVIPLDVNVSGLPSDARSSAARPRRHAD
jgi:hypothetical protein